MVNKLLTNKESRFDYLLFGLIVLLFIGILTVIVSRFGVNILWFQELGYSQTFWIRFETKLFLGLFSFLISLLFLWGNLALANHQKKQQRNFLILGKNKLYPQSPELKLRTLLPLIVSFCLIISLSLIYYTQVTNKTWELNVGLPNLKPPVPSPFEIIFLNKLIGNFNQQQIWSIFVVIIIMIFLFWKTQFWLKAIAFYYSLIFSLLISGDWIRILRFFNAVPFGENDPIFDYDISFYIFKLPFLEIVDSWLQGLFFYALVSVTLTYLLANQTISEGKFLGFSHHQLRHIYILGSGLMLSLAGFHWLNRYLLLFSTKGVVFGAGYTELKIALPRETFISILALIIGIWLLIKFATRLGKYTEKYSHEQYQHNQNKLLAFSSLPFILYGCLYLGGIIVSELVQNTIVQPNELALEKPYIINNIKATRSAFNLDEIEVKTFNPKDNLTAEDIANNYLTIDNIRLWDTRPILQTNRQLQQIRPYYVFPDADIDRYNIKTTKNNSQKKQVILAARELNYELIPQQAKTWVNQHLVYTHGYGFTMSPVNRVGEAGLPFYFIKDIGTADDPGALNTSSVEVRESIPIFRPRIYYGEMANNYVIVNTNVPEFDFPSGDENVYHTYQGEGGIKLNSAWKRWLFALNLRDWRMLLTNNFNPETRILFRRNINERVKAIAPFLYYDRDPYLVIGTGKNDGEKDNLYWLIDAYTISDYYPYSDPGENHFNYIRNSVKVLINAENGKTNFYIADPKDPLIQGLQKIFGELFKPLNEMPPDIKEHIRYPIDLFDTQSERLLIYHMTDPQVFYNREDQWQIPEEIYGNEALSIQPYYLIMKLPIADEEEFILLHPYTPKSRPNLIAWLAARCDGDNYGKLLLYKFPKQKLIYGPDQIQALINQDPVISGQISLWNRQGSKAVQGNLLVIPIEDSLLYVEPVYLEAEKNSLPTLARVIVVYENQIVMANSLQNALDGIFKPQQPQESTIIRPLQNPPISTIN